MSMRFGLFGGPSRRTTGPDANSQADRDAYSAYVDHAQAAEALGFYGAYLVEHHFTGRGQVSASLNLLSFLAARTQSIRLGTAVVVVPWHNPLLLAEQAATVDVLSGGRLDLGLGRGYREIEFLGFGVPPEEADPRFQETVAVLRKAWSSNERFSHAGRFWQFSDVVIEPRPIQQPPPLWVGAASERSIDAAARDGFRLFLDQVGSFEQTAQRIARYRSSKEAAGLEVDQRDIAVTRPLLLATSDGERAALIERHEDTLEFLAGVPGSAGHNPFYSDPARRSETAEASAIVGSPEECIERLQRLADGGCSQVLFTGGSIPMLERFAREVMPAFAG